MIGLGGIDSNFDISENDNLGLCSNRSYWTTMLSAANQRPKYLGKVPNCHQVGYGPAESFLALIDNWFDIGLQGNHKNQQDHHGRGSGKKVFRYLK